MREKVYSGDGPEAERSLLLSAIVYDTLMSAPKGGGHLETGVLA